MIITKNSKSMGALEFKEIEYELAKKVLIKEHYSKKWNTAFGKINVGIFKENQLKGVASFGNLMNPNSHSKITDLGKDSVIELNRMWISDDLGKNSESMLISSSLKIIKKLYPHIKFVQSFADGRLGCGTIYKASNFNYYGYSETLFFQDDVTDEIIHKDRLENTKRPVSFLEKNTLFLNERLTPFKVKTYRYIYPLDKKHKVKLTELPYPEYEKGKTFVKHTPSNSLVARLLIMYEMIGNLYYAQKAKSYLIGQGVGEMELNKLKNNQMKNTSVIWFEKEYLSNEKNKEKLIRLLENNE